MIRFAENLNKMITAGLGGALEAPRTEVAVGHRVIYTEASGAVVNFESNMVAPVKNLRVTMEPIQAGSGDPSPENVRPITGRDAVTVYRSGSDMSNPQIVTVQLGQTVYGGTLDVTAGTMTVDRAMVDLGTLTWITSSASSSAQAVGKAMQSTSAITQGVSSSTIPSIVCSVYHADSNDRIYAGKVAVGVVSSGNIKVYDTRFFGLSKAEIRALLSGTQLVYPITEPLTITLTPEQLSTLKGPNNVWSDAGNISLKYPYYEETEGY